MRENKFQADLVKRLKKIFPGCLIFKGDIFAIQGFPDLLILWKKHWAALECKRSRSAKKRPNQDFWIDICNKMSFARFVYPENCEEVLNELQQTFHS